MPTSLEILKEKFGYENFRFNQEKIIETVLQQRDAFVLMPTGGGKSLCYQIPALIFDGLTVVISPLISLMKDQVDALRVAGISAAYLNSSLSSEEYSTVYSDLRNGRLKLLYIAPERLFNNEQQFISFLKDLKVSLFAIDEAHCISHWGHDFRPEYRMLSSLKEEFPSVPIIALTATADDLTRKDILEKLQLQDPDAFISSFNRPNIHYFIEPKRGHYDRLVDYLDRRRDDSGIIYVLSRQSAEDLAKKLSYDGFSALPYHAGLETEERTKNQNLFIRDEVKIIVATIAFGMGINKSNVRFVIHVNLPKNIESYYQETGRAGRDGLKSDAILYYSAGDLAMLKKFAIIEGNPEQSRIMLNKLSQMANLCENQACRRKSILNYFGEEAADNCESCDVCLYNYEKFDGTEIAQKALSAVARLDGRFGLVYTVDFLRGSKSEKIREEHKTLTTYGVGAEFSKEDWYGYFKNLIGLGFLKQVGNEYPILNLTEKSPAVLRGEEKVFLTKTISRKVAVDSEKPYEMALFDDLKKLRYQLAQKENVPAYIIFSDATLLELATYLPQSLEEIRRISGFGEFKLAKYGSTFLDAVVTYCRSHDLTSKISEKIHKRERKSKEPLGLARGAVAAEKENDTKTISLELFRRGKTLGEIAALRDLAVSTIESHLAFYVLFGAVKVTELVSEEKIKRIIAVAKKYDSPGLSPIKEELGDYASYGEIRAVVNYLKRDK